MGSPLSERGRIDGEDEHPVALTRHFFMQTSEVTQGQWESVMGYNPSHFDQCGADCPVESVSWLEALWYANARSRSEGLETCYDLSSCTGSPGMRLRCARPFEIDVDCTGYRLPTEAEWEYAYRAGTRTAFFNGDPDSRDTCAQPLLQEIAQFCGNCSSTYGQSYDCSGDGARPDQPTDCATTSVGQRQANALGLYDMAGNVAEMVWDAPGDYPAMAVDPMGPEHESLIVVRGAGFCGHMSRLRAADRKSTTYIATSLNVGFRLARTFRKASRDEVDPDLLCSNGCGGCGELAPAPGTACGPCGADEYVCDGPEATQCNGSTTCNIGASCLSDEDCDHGYCSNDHCALANYVYVPSGSFIMGSAPDEYGRSALESQHEVTLSKPFLMSSTEATQKQWKDLMGYNPSHFDQCGSSCPVESISWLDVLAYANAVSKAYDLQPCYDLSSCTGEPGNRLRCPASLSFSLSCSGYRMPTEAEWEYAYRAGSTTTFYNGDPESRNTCAQPLLEEIANFCGNCSVDYPGGFDCSGDGQRPHMLSHCGPKPVGEYLPNRWGLYDMSGNVGEFVWDTHGEYPGDTTDPLGAEHDGLKAVVRGAGFCGHLARLRAADRSTANWITHKMGTGVRLVRSIP
ncbi:MAG: formylglycine-generating enzyme family protein [Bradymonadaceae bacterium]|nr:formylglycine-generating enzyme family protein [Lujinxingiaceae bacterium]